MQKFFDATQIPKESVAPGLNRQVLGYSPKIMLVRATFEKGAEGYVHQHFHEQVTFVESGEFEVRIGDEKKVLKAGDSFYIPPDLIHGAICLKAGALIDVFTPAREDFLK